MRPSGSGSCSDGGVVVWSAGGWGGWLRKWVLGWLGLWQVRAMRVGRGGELESVPQVGVVYEAHARRQVRVNGSVQKFYRLAEALDEVAVATVATLREEGFSEEASKLQRCGPREVAELASCLSQARPLASRSTPHPSVW